MDAAWIELLHRAYRRRGFLMCQPQVAAVAMTHGQEGIELTIEEKSGRRRVELLLPAVIEEEPALTVQAA